MENKIKPTIVVYVGENRELTIHETTMKAQELLDTNIRPIHYIIFKHTTLDEIKSMSYKQAIETERTRKAKANER